MTSVVPGADPASFEVLNRAFGRDAAHVYFESEAIAGADPRSFVPLDENYGRDARAVFRGTERCPDCDVETFRRVQPGVYADRETVFVDRDPGSSGFVAVWRIRGADIATLARVNREYVRDGRRVFHPHGEVPGADVASFRIGPNGPEDANPCYVRIHAVPCRELGDLRADRKVPLGHSTLPRNRAVLVTGEDLSADEGVGLVQWPVVANQRILAPGAAGAHVACRHPNGDAVFVPPGGFRAGRLSYVVRRAGSTCELEEAPVALVRGRVDGPALWVVGQDWGTRVVRFKNPSGGPSPEPEQPEPQLQLLVGAGRQTLRVLCRRVTREAAVELAVEPTFEPEAGRIYDLEATFAADGKACEVRAVPR